MCYFDVYFHRSADIFHSSCVLCVQGDGEKSPRQRRPSSPSSNSSLGGYGRYTPCRSPQNFSRPGIHLTHTWHTRPSYIYCCCYVKSLSLYFWFLKDHITHDSCYITHTSLCALAFILLSEWWGTRWFGKSVVYLGENICYKWFITSCWWQYPKPEMKCSSTAWLNSTTLYITLSKTHWMIWKLHGCQVYYFYFLITFSPWRQRFIGWYVMFNHCKYLLFIA